MPDTRTPAQTISPRRLSRHRRVKRGIVASYIHQLSERHNDDSQAAATTAPAPTTPARPHEQLA
jgi:hypothetical protein